MTSKSPWTALHCNTAGNVCLCLPTQNIGHSPAIGHSKELRRLDRLLLFRWWSPARCWTSSRWLIVMVFGQPLASSVSLLDRAEAKFHLCVSGILRSLHMAPSSSHLTCRIHSTLFLSLCPSLCPQRVFHFLSFSLLALDSFRHAHSLSTSLPPISPSPFLSP